jgi:DNA polymerase III subunit epsilon
MNYVVIDFETTGLDYKKEQITEVALIKYDQEFNEIGSFNTVVQLEEGRVLSDFIKNLTGLTEEYLEKGMREVDVWYMVDTFIDHDTIVVAQYVPFDLAYMSYRGGIEPERFICTKSLTSQVEPTESSSLVPTCERLGIPLESAHRAFADVRATADLLQYRLKENKAQFVENYIVKSPDRDLNFIPNNTIEVLDKNSFIKEEN